MGSTTQTSLKPPSSFLDYLQNSSRIVALLGAGLSASSGIPTFRGAGSSWRGLNPPQDLANLYCFQQDPVLFWQFFDDRRHLALKAKPNRGHYALAKLARLKPDFLAISQNIDGLSERAGHDPWSLVPIHGSLFDLECSNDQCDYATHDSINDHVISNFHVRKDVDIADPGVDLPPTSIAQLPHCPRCQLLMRPAVVLFYEKLYQSTCDKIDDWMGRGAVDLVLVIGTSFTVYPAADYIRCAVESGARVAVFDMEPRARSIDDLALGEDDWYFKGDAAEVLPELLKGIIGEI